MAGASLVARALGEERDEEGPLPPRRSNHSAQQERRTQRTAMRDREQQSGKKETSLFLHIDSALEKPRLPLFELLDPWGHVRAQLVKAQGTVFTGVHADIPG